MRKAPKVVHLVSPAATGGVETVVRLLATGRARRGLDTEVIAITREGDQHPFVADLRSAHIPVTVRAPRGRRYLSEIRDIASLATQRGADVIHTHVYRSDYIGYFAARRAGVAAVSTFHGETGGDWLNRLYEWSVKRLFRRFDAVICVSEVNRDKLRAAGSDLSNAHLVRNGAAFEAALDRSAARRQLGLDPEAAVIGWIGRLSREKGPDLMLDAFACLRGSDAQLVVIGEGPLKAALQRRVRETGLRVVFAGSVPHASRLLPAFDLVVLSSRMEGMPMVLLEAMSNAVPVAAFLVGGIPELLSSRTGWPAPAENVTGLAGALESALREKGQSAHRARQGQALIRERCDVGAWIDAVETVYAAALNHA